MEGWREAEQGEQGGLFVLPSASARTRPGVVVVGWGDVGVRGSAGKQREGRKKQKEKRRKEKEASLPSPCMQIERILEHRCHMTRTGGDCTPSTQRGCVSSAMMS